MCGEAELKNGAGAVRSAGCVLHDVLPVIIEQVCYFETGAPGSTDKDAKLARVET